MRVARLPCDCATLPAHPAQLSLCATAHSHLSHPGMPRAFLWADPIYRCLPGPSRVVETRGRRLSHGCNRHLPKPASPRGTGPTPTAKALEKHVRPPPASILLRAERVGTT